MFIDTQERPAGEVQQKVGRLKLSEAIRIGAKLRPQCFASYFDGVRTCAIGAAWEGSGHPARAGVGWEVTEYFGVDRSLTKEAERRNDLHESRESIADWLQSQGL